MLEEGLSFVKNTDFYLLVLGMASMCTRAYYIYWYDAICRYKVLR